MYILNRNGNILCNADRLQSLYIRSTAIKVSEDAGGGYELQKFGSESEAKTALIIIANALNEEKRVFIIPSEEKCKAESLRTKNPYRLSLTDAERTVLDSLL